MTDKKLLEKGSQWIKTSFCYCPSGELSWSQSHATVPTPLLLENSLVRVFFCTRDELLRNRVGYVDLDIQADDVRIVQEAQHPVIDLGEPGHFDCDGVYATCLVNSPEGLRFYYAGWNAGLRRLFYSALGVAVSCDQGRSFERFSKAPILGRDEVDPWACMAPFVLQKPDGQWVMWYASGIELGYDKAGKLRSQYDIKTAVSSDGFHWKKTGKAAIGLGNRDTNIARACVILDRGLFRAWYPYVRKQIEQYRIGYGESHDGLTFVRKDNAPEALIEPSQNDQDWDGQAVTYPHVFALNGRIYMLYNGNNFGATGFGLAIWK